MSRSPHPDVRHDDDAAASERARIALDGCFEGSSWPSLCLDDAARILESNLAARHWLLGERAPHGRTADALHGRTLTTLASPDGHCATPDWWTGLIDAWSTSTEVRPVTLVAERERYDETPARVWLARRVELAPATGDTTGPPAHAFSLVACPAGGLPLTAPERLLFERGPVAAQITDARGGLIAVNPSWCGLLGYACDDARLAGRSWRGLLATDDERDAHAWGRLQVALAAGQPIDDVRLTLARSDDHVVTVRVATCPLTAGASLVYLEDLTELERIETDRRESSEQIDANDRARTAFFAAVSHELRTPLNAILGYSQLLARRGGLEPDHERAIGAIRRCGQQLLTLVDEVLDRAHIAGLRERPVSGIQRIIEPSATPSAHDDDRERRRTGYQGRRRTLLLVDDRAENRAVLGDVLAPLGFDILEVDSGLAAVEAVASQAPDLVLMDLVMPGIDGIEATRRIRALPGSGSQVRIVAVTASIFEADRLGSQQAGCDAFVSKPIDVTELLDCLGEQLELTWTGPAPAPSQAPAAGAADTRVEVLGAEAREALEALHEAAAEGRIVDARLALAELELALRESPVPPGWGAIVEQLGEMVADFRLSQVCSAIESFAATPGAGGGGRP